MFDWPDLDDYHKPGDGIRLYLSWLNINNKSLKLHSGKTNRVERIKF